MQQDMIPPLTHVDATSVDDAVATLQEHGTDAATIAGNTDEINWMKNRMRTPEVLVDLKGIDEMRGIESTSDGGVRIGALTTLSNVVDSDAVNAGFSVIADAAGEIATPQIRNQGTIGGNITQDSRCWYYRNGFDCYRAGGNTCYAITGESRDHAVTDYSRCITAHPSDGAVALMALEAEVVIEGPRGTRREPLSDFFVGPEENITVMNDLAHEEILTHIEVPSTWSGASFYYEKVTDRESWDFPIVNIAAAIQTSGGSVSDVRIVSNGLAPTPKRLRNAESAITGQQITESNAASAAGTVLPNAAPQPDNRFKLGLAENLTERALLGAE
ncbi:FAD binding domain-containing protein [Halobellus clavatus]|jgi:xanthine dehydrogenase YagS FAD-binding subunit|uniref:Xanthine dehydrogenase YagS FAD-binding subunit n=1 Tax=Halobellus clavatus TaxID=660517 RepID=A0A1H3FXV4_9EURY|nr:xanthine dehydrogenase family protein subunit M [Halobellus clavatus]SDX95902.1 xanthine dehydrogenase YagS FAD-binding subunit [Halobellus clavatus]